MFESVMLVVSVFLLALVARWCANARRRFMLMSRRIAGELAQMDGRLLQSYSAVDRIVEAAAVCQLLERRAVEAVAQARTRAMAAVGEAIAATDRAAIQALSAAESDLQCALERLARESERVADTGVRRRFEQLFDGLGALEDEVAAARLAYNVDVMAYNTWREVFPANWIAALCHFEAAEPLDLKSAARSRTPQSLPA